MRLSNFDREVIRRTTAEVAGADARAMLFGSRTQADRRGGDIDLLIELPRPCADRLALGLRLGARLDQQLGLQKIDILVVDAATPDSPLLQAARGQAVPV